METLNIIQTKEIMGGGWNPSGAFLNAAKSCINAIFEVGQALGGAIRRISSGNLCRF